MPTPFMGRLHWNVVRVYKYNENLYKTVFFKTGLRVSGFEDDSGFVRERGVNSEKLENNVARAKAKIFALAVCNPWDYFVTLTLSPLKWDRYNLSAFYKTFTQWLHNLKKQFGMDVKYLFIPEMHKDGAWHLHGFIRGVPADGLRQFTLTENIPPYIRKKIQGGASLFDWPGYREKFGYVVLEPVRDANRAASYVTKYVTKNLASCVKDLNANMYYHSKGLLVPQRIKEGTADGSTVPPKWLFENDYVAVRYDTAETLATSLGAFTWE